MTMRFDTELLVGGAFEAGQEPGEKVLNPRTGGLILDLPEASTDQVDRAVAAAKRAFGGWSRTTPAERSAALLAIAERIEADADAFAALEALNCGKPINAARGDEIPAIVDCFRFFAGAVRCQHGTIAGEYMAGHTSMIRRDAVGVVASIAPWNYPLMMMAWKLAPAIGGGNTVVFKPSSDAPLSGIRLVEALEKAGVPAGVVNCVTGRAGEVGPVITNSSNIRAISFTGSTTAGTQIHRTVHLTTRLQMELGGKNPLIVMEDADLDLAVDLAIKGGFSLTGQACTGTSRILVVPSVKQAFTDKLLARVAALKIGNGMQPGLDLGPLATEKQLQTVLKYIAIGKSEARLLCGGERLTGAEFDKGYYVSPAVFTDVKNSMRIAQEEIFGPVLAIIEVADFNDALATANDTEYGLSASIVTNNPRYMHVFTNEIQSGTVKINRTTTGNLVNAPFGGLKNSSTSTFRESGRAGLEFFTQLKTVYRGV